MYRAFDKFLRVDTWHTTHPLDDERFHQALNEVVRLKGFHPSDMADYFRSYLGAKASHFEDAIDMRHSQADHIRSFLYDIGDVEN